jgi:hypothetical protein
MQPFTFCAHSTALVDWRPSRNKRSQFRSKKMTRKGSEVGLPKNISDTLAALHLSFSTHAAPSPLPRCGHGIFYLDEPLAKIMGLAHLSLWCYHTLAMADALTNDALGQSAGTNPWGIPASCGCDSCNKDEHCAATGTIDIILSGLSDRMVNHETSNVGNCLLLTTPSSSIS